VSYQRCAITGFLIEVVKISSISPQSWTWIVRSATRAIRTFATYQFNLFLRHWRWVLTSEMDRRINGYGSLEHLRMMRQGLPTLSLSLFLYEYVARKSCGIFSLVCLSSFIYSRILFPCSSLMAPRAVTPNTRKPLRSLEIYFHLRRILRMNRTSRIDENKAELK